MEMLITVAIVTAVIGRGAGLIVSDLKYAAKGKEHPRWAYKQAKLEAARRGEPTGYWALLAARSWRKAFDKHADAAARKAAGPAREPRGPRPFRDYLGRCWADAWKTQELRHDKRVAERRRRRGEAPDEDPEPESVSAPTDADLTPTSAEPGPDGVDDTFDSVPRDTSAEAVEHESVTAPVDQSPAAAKTYTESIDPTMARIQELANEERRLRLEYARERARAYLYGEGPFDRKPNDEDIRVLSRGNEADRSMADTLRVPNPELDRQWDEAVKRQDEEILRRFQAEHQTTDQPWSPYASGETDSPDANRSPGATGRRKEHENPTDATESDYTDNVIPIRQSTLPEPKGVAPLSETDNEIDGLESAKAWAMKIKQNAEAMTDGIDDVESQFAAWEITGESLAKVPEIGEAYEQLAALAGELQDLLSRMDSVSEAYDEAPDAGNKQFVTS
ncbi:hypothetical protein GCM10027447_02070 [Glycomyces halotolerans]